MYFHAQETKKFPLISNIWPNLLKPWLKLKVIFTTGKWLLNMIGAVVWLLNMIGAVAVWAYEASTSPDLR